MRISVLLNNNYILKMVQESGSKSFMNVNTAVSRKDTGYVSDPMAGR